MNHFNTYLQWNPSQQKFCYRGEIKRFKHKLCCTTPTWFFHSIFQAHFWHTRLFWLKWIVGPIILGDGIFSVHPHKSFVATANIHQDLGYDSIMQDLLFELQIIIPSRPLPRRPLLSCPANWKNVLDISNLSFRQNMLVVCHSLADFGSC